MLHSWPQPAAEPVDAFTPCLAWAWALVARAGDDDTLAPVLARACGARVELLLVRGLSRPTDGSDSGASLHVLQQRATFEVSSTSRAPARESS